MRRTWVSILLVGLVLLGALVLQQSRQRGPRAAAAVETEGDALTHPDVEIGYVPSRSATSARWHPASDLRFHVHTDSRGARVSAPGTETRVPVGLVTVGGSYAWGHGVENEETFSAQLGEALGVPVANLALAGYGTVQSLQRLERHLDLAPRLVVYAFIEDHLRRNLAPCAPSYGDECFGWSHVVFDETGTPSLRVPSELLQAVAPAGAQERTMLARGVSLFWALAQRARGRSSDFEDDAERRTEAMRLLLSRMRDAAGSVDAQLLVVHLPWFESDPDPPPPALLESLPRGAHFLDLSSAVRRHYSTGGLSLVLQDDGHPNQRAHALVARELEAFLTRQELKAVVEERS